jgi:hypothetical protein
MRKQLRIGNLVEIENHTKVCEVIEIKEKSLRVSYIRSDNGMVHNPIIEIDRIKPISITEEYLIKFGFENSHRIGQRLFFSIGNLYVELTGDNRCAVYYHSETIICFLESVNQLQNLFFALTGEELTFKSK